jgi:hypothetical protein
MVVEVWMGVSGRAFCFHDDIVEHLMYFGVVLEVVGEELAGELEDIGLFVVPASHEHLEPLELELGELKLLHAGEQNGLAPLELLPNVGRFVDHPLDVHLELSTGELLHYFLVRAESVGVMDIDEVRLHVVRNGLVVLGLPESGLAGGAVEPPLQHERQIHQLNNQYTPIKLNYPIDSPIFLD